MERLRVWKQASHNLLDSIGIIQARGFSSSHQSLGDYLEGENPWVLLDLVTDCARQHTQSRSPHQHTDQRAKQRPLLLSTFPHHARMGIKGRLKSLERAVGPGRRAGSHRSVALGERPGDASPGGYAHRKVSPSTLRLPGGAGPSTGEWALPWPVLGASRALSFRFP